jgi:hypothetical protein
VRGFVDLHCHWIAAIDDGAPTRDEGLAMLRALRGAGFDFVMATPHMRPALFDNAKTDLERAFHAMAIGSESDMPEVGLSSEHYFDDIVFQRLMSGEALPYPGGKAVLVEFPTDAFPARVADRFFDLRMRKLRQSGRIAPCSIPFSTAGSYFCSTSLPSPANTAALRNAPPTNYWRTVTTSRRAAMLTAPRTSKTSRAALPAWRSSSGKRKPRTFWAKARSRF